MYIKILLHITRHTRLRGYRPCAKTSSPLARKLLVCLFVYETLHHGENNKMENIKLESIEKEDHNDILNIMKSLNKWFDESALKNIVIDLKYHKGYIAKDKDEIIGFIIYFVYEGIGNIGWIGVKIDYQNKKIGKKLLERIESDFKENGINIVQVYTLSDTVEYKPFENTRMFYYNNGFNEYRRVKTNNPNCPEELYLRKIL
jgi:ribosomal protein S18 acetylase RimI-like enzyme